MLDVYILGSTTNQLFFSFIGFLIGHLSLQKILYGDISAPRNGLSFLVSHTTHKMKHGRGWCAFDLTSWSSNQISNASTVSSSHIPFTLLMDFVALHTSLVKKHWTEISLILTEFSSKNSNQPPQIMDLLCKRHRMLTLWPCQGDMQTHFLETFDPCL